MTALASLLAETNDLLRVTGAQLRDRVRDVAVGAAGPGNAQELENWPVAGRRRVVVGERATGGVLSFPGGGYDLLPDQPGRLGLRITNIGPGSPDLYLVPAAVQATAVLNPHPTIPLEKVGDTWDGLLSLVPWTGPISIFTNPTTLLVAVT